MIEKTYPPLNELTNKQLALILCDFYVEVKKKNVEDYEEEDAEQEELKTSYKTTTLHAIRGALTRYFKDTRQIDIRSDPMFIKANEMFLGKMKQNKQKGLGKIDNKPPINDSDLKLIAEYFKKTMAGPPNPKGLQQIVIFNIIYYLCRRGRENLRPMKKTTFAIDTDPTNGKEYIYQKEDEADKNHSVCDTSIANQGRIYAIPGNFLLLFDH